MRAVVVLSNFNVKILSGNPVILRVSKQFLEIFFIIFGAFVFQSYIIFPIESFLRVDNNTNIVSLIYIPHGIKVALILAFGLSATPAIFAGMIMINIFLAGSMNMNTTMVYGAFVGTLCMVIPLLFHNLSFRKSVFSAPMFDGENNKNNLWLFLSFAFAASVLNSLGQSAINEFNPTLLPWMFLIGDLAGAVVVFFALTFFVRPLLLSFLRTKSD